MYFVCDQLENVSVVSENRKDPDLGIQALAEAFPKCIYFEASIEIRPTIYGLCLNCGSIETRLNNQTGYRDFSKIGESSTYPVGYGCELCD